MDLDLKRFCELVPIDALGESSLRTLVSATRVERRVKGERLFTSGERDKDAVYLLAGEVTLDDHKGHQMRISADDDKSRFALSHLKPRRFDAYVASASAEVARVDATLLERMVAWEQLSPDQDSGMQVTELDEVADSDRDWMLSLLQSPAFLRLPPANLESLFQALEPVNVEEGETVIRMGEPGDYYYLIREGRCEVSRTVNGCRTVLASLGPGEAFGEEALISDAPRNADVTMITAGRLMRLGKAEFRWLVEKPLIREVDLKTAADLVERGATRIDVRTEDEFGYWGVDGSLNIPLYLLRLKLKRLDPTLTYIVYCDTGERSAAAAFLMARRGLDVYVLQGGLTAAENQDSS